MNVHTLLTLLSTVLALAAATGCGRKSTSADGGSAESPAATAPEGGWPSAKAVPADRLEWRRRTLVKAYEDAGEHSPRWDADAREALEAFARLPLDQDTNTPAIFQAGLKRAVDAGSTDPLIRYLNLRFTRGDAWEANSAAAGAYRENADQLMASDYPDVRKFYGALRAAVAWRTAYGSSSNTTEVLGHYRRSAFSYLQPVLQNPETPFSEAYDAADELRRGIFSNPRQEIEILPSLISYFQTRWPNEARALTLCGRANVSLAWNRRGSGYADSVTPAGWKEFARYLAEAERCLERSWTLDSTNSGTAVAMMEVELGQGRGRDRMELWFQRAMAVDPACFDAAHAKAWYLQPKWHGSAPDALTFGHECIESKEWKGRVPLILWEAHRMLAEDKAAGLKDAYWKQSGVWEDVRDSFNRFFELNPEAIGWRHDYALYAYKSGQYGAFLDLVPQMGWVNLPFFGGEQAFAEMIAKAERETGRQATVPK